MRSTKGSDWKHMSFQSSELTSSYGHTTITIFQTTIHEKDCSCCCWVASVVPDSVWPHRWRPTRPPCPWDSPGENTGVGMKKTATYQKPSFITKDTNKEPHKVGRRIYIVKSTNPGWATPQKLYCRGFSKKWKVWAPHQAPQPRNHTPGKWTLTAFGFEGQKGLLSGDPEGWGK